MRCRIFAPGRVLDDGSDQVLTGNVSAACCTSAAAPKLATQLLLPAAMPPPPLPRSFDCHRERHSAARGWRPVRLPPGGWHTNLTRLELPHAILAAPAVLQALQACTQLEELTVGRFSLPPQQPLPEALQFVAWAAALPRLARLTVGLCEGWSQVPPYMPRQYERKIRLNNFLVSELEPAECMLQRQGLAAMAALTTAVAKLQVRRPGLTIRVVSDTELHPDGQEGEWVPHPNL